MSSEKIPESYVYKTFLVSKYISIAGDALRAFEYEGEAWDGGARRLGLFVDHQVYALYSRTTR